MVASRRIDSPGVIVISRILCLQAIAASGKTAGMSGMCNVVLSGFVLERLAHHVIGCIC